MRSTVHPTKVPSHSDLHLQISLDGFSTVCAPCILQESYTFNSAYIEPHSDMTSLTCISYYTFTTQSRSYACKLFTFNSTSLWKPQRVAGKILKSKTTFNSSKAVEKWRPNFKLQFGAKTDMRPSQSFQEQADADKAGAETLLGDFNVAYRIFSLKNRYMLEKFELLPIWEIQSSIASYIILLNTSYV